MGPGLDLFPELKISNSIKKKNLLVDSICLSASNAALSSEEDREGLEREVQYSIRGGKRDILCFSLT
jgi:hypothetical protein